MKSSISNHPIEEQSFNNFAKRLKFGLPINSS